MTYLQQLLSRSVEDLANDLYNIEISRICDSINGQEKLIPYLGSFWRDVDFVKKQISIAHGDRFTGVCESNSWGYSSRLMTESEVDTFIGFLDRIIELKSIRMSQQKIVLKECWDWFQALKIEER